jgi:hypothetical protein
MTAFNIITLEGNYQSIRQNAAELPAQAGSKLIADFRSSIWGRSQAWQPERIKRERDGYASPSPDSLGCGRSDSRLLPDFVSA